MIFVEKQGKNAAIEVINQRMTMANNSKDFAFFVIVCFRITKEIRNEKFEHLSFSGTSSSLEQTSFFGTMEYFKECFPLIFLIETKSCIHSTFKNVKVNEFIKDFLNRSSFLNHFSEVKIEHSGIPLIGCENVKLLY